MRDEHKIILSTYYVDYKMNSSYRMDSIFYVGMDMMQLLFLMKGVFEQTEFEYHIEDNKVQLRPKSDKEMEYNAMLVTSDEELQKAKIIEIGIDSTREFEALDYLKADNYLQEIPRIKDDLYFLILLTKWFNCTSKVKERGNISYYYLFSNQSGKEFVHHLFVTVLQILMEYRHGEIERANCVIKTLNSDLDSMEKCYNNVQDVLDSMMLRNEAMSGNMYRQNFFINSFDKTNSWICEHRGIATQYDIWEFIFSQNHIWQGYAKCLIRHIIQINHSLLGKREALQWEKSVRSISAPQEFYHLERLIEELKGQSRDTSFDRMEWVRRYIKKMKELIDVLDMNESKI